MMSWILPAAFVASVTLDAWSGHGAAARGAREQILWNRSPWVVDAQLAAAGTAELFATRWLWTHGHRRLAVAILAGSTAGHGWAAVHNLRVNR